MTKYVENAGLISKGYLYPKRNWAKPHQFFRDNWGSICQKMSYIALLMSLVCTGAYILQEKGIFEISIDTVW